MRRHELSDEEWALVGPLLPRQARGGRWNDHRTTLGGMLWIASESGATQTVFSFTVPARP